MGIIEILFIVYSLFFCILLFRFCSRLGNLSQFEWSMPEKSMMRRVSGGVCVYIILYATNWKIGFFDNRNVRLVFYLHESKVFIQHSEFNSYTILEVCFIRLLSFHNEVFSIPTSLPLAVFYSGAPLGRTIHSHRNTLKAIKK